MKNQATTPKIGRDRQGFSSDPLGAFFMEHFKDFAWRFAKPRDLEPLAITCSPNEWPIVGNRQLLPTLFRIAAFPEKIIPQSEDSRLFLVCLKRSPDFVLGLITHLRRAWGKCKPHKKETLLGLDSDKLSDAAKTERGALRNLAKAATQDRKEALQYCESKYPIGELNEIVIVRKKTRRVSKKKPR